MNYSNIGINISRLFLMKYLFIFLAFIDKIIASGSIFQIPFKYNKHSYMNVSDSLYNDMTIDLCLGRPKQCLNCALSNMQYLSFLFDISMHKTGFNESGSSSYKTKIDHLYLYYFRSHGNYARLSTDYVYIDPIQHETVEVLLPFFFDVHYNLPDPNGCILGLQLFNAPNFPISDSLSFIDKLYYSNIISHKSYSIEYINNTDGIFALGENLLGNSSGLYQGCNFTRATKYALLIE